MFTPASMGCSEHNSSSPITQAQIAREDAYKNRIGSIFDNGNKTLSDIIAVLTPPVPSGLCSDLTSSSVLYNQSPFPDYNVTGQTLPRPSGLGRLRRRGMDGWPQMLSTGTYGSPHPGFQYDISDLIPIWGCTPQAQPNPAASGPVPSPSVATTILPPSSSCWPWPCLILVLAGIAALMPSGKKAAKRAVARHRARRK